MLVKQMTNLIVSRLIEIEIPLAHGIKRLRHACAGDLIGKHCQVAACFGSANRNCNNNPRWLELLNRLHGGPH